MGGVVVPGQNPVEEKKKGGSKATLILLILLVLALIGVGVFFAWKYLFSDNGEGDEGAREEIGNSLATAEGRWVEDIAANPWAIPTDSVLTKAPHWKARMPKDATDLEIITGGKAFVVVNAASIQAISTDNGEILWELANPGFVRCDNYRDLWCSGENSFGIISADDGSILSLPTEINPADEYLGAGVFLAKSPDSSLSIKVFSADSPALERTCDVPGTSAEISMSQFHRFAAIFSSDDGNTPARILTVDTSNCQLSEPFAVKEEFAHHTWRFIEGSDGWLAKPHSAPGQEPVIAQVLSVGFTGEITDLGNTVMPVGVRYVGAGDDLPVRTREQLYADFSSAELHPDTTRVRVITDIDFQVVSWDDFTRVEGIDTPVFNGVDSSVWGMSADHQVIYAWDSKKYVLRAIATADSQVMAEVSAIGLYHLGTHTVIFSPEEIIGISD